MAEHNALGPAGRAAREDDQRRLLLVAIPCGRAALAAAAAALALALAAAALAAAAVAAASMPRLLDAEEGAPLALGDRLGPRGERLARGGHHARVGLRHSVPQLRVRVRHAQRHRDAPGLPDADQRPDKVGARRREERDALAPREPPLAADALTDCVRSTEQIGVARARAISVDDGGAASGGVLLQACEQAASGQAHPARQAAGRLHLRSSGLLSDFRGATVNARSTLAAESGPS